MGCITFRKLVFVLLACVCSVFSMAQTVDSKDKTDSFIKAAYVNLREIQEENVIVKTRVIIMVTNDYVIPCGSTLRGFVHKEKFYFHVDLNYYEVPNYFVWDVKSYHPYRTIDEMKAESAKKKAEKAAKKKAKAEKKRAEKSQKDGYW